MKVEVSMTVEKTLFEVNHWWATDPAFAIAAFKAQLAAAKVIFPELKEYHFGTVAKKPPISSTPK